MRLGPLLRKWRNASGLGLRQLSAEVGVPASTLCRMERGRNVREESFAKVLEWLTGSGPLPTPKPKPAGDPRRRAAQQRYKATLHELPQACAAVTDAPPTRRFASREVRAFVAQDFAEVREICEERREKARGWQEERKAGSK